MQADSEEPDGLHGHVCHSSAGDSKYRRPQMGTGQVQQLQQEIARLKKERQVYQKERQEWLLQMERMGRRIRELEESWRRTCPPCGYRLD